MKIAPAALLLGLCLLLGPATAPLAAQPWIHIDTRSATLAVIAGGKVRLRMRNLAFGRGGFAEYRLRGDQSTPLGEFRVHKVKNDSPFHRFVQFTYPSLEHTDWARANGIIDARTYGEILDALLARELPPQDTPLGGYLGIHGLSEEADLDIHRRFNWTRGCIALTNPQIDALLPWVRVGTRVVVE